MGGIVTTWQILLLANSLFFVKSSMVTENVWLYWLVFGVLRINGDYVDISMWSKVHT